MGAPLNLLNQQFGLLTVIEKTENRDSAGSVIWKCNCKCDTITLVSTQCLKSGNTKSCGCFNKSRESKVRFKDLTGQVYNRLTVINITDKVENESVMWNCLCSCGVHKLVSTKNLHFNTSSCGCFGREQRLKANTKHGQSKTQEYKNYISAKRRAAKLQRTVKWANMEAIKEIYKNCPEGHHVDHIIPLQGEFVSGFHVEYNLQYLTEFANQSKNNKFDCTNI